MVLPHRRYLHLRLLDQRRRPGGPPAQSDRRAFGPQQECGFAIAMGLSSWEEVTILSEVGQPSSFNEVPDNGYTLCILWAAPASNVRRVRNDVLVDERIVVRISRSGVGPSQPEERARTQEELDLIAEFSNAFLAEANIPPRPDRFRWFLYRGSTQLLPPFNEIVTEVASRHGQDESAPSVLEAAQATFKQYSTPLR